MSPSAWIMGGVALAIIAQLVAIMIQAARIRALKQKVEEARRETDATKARLVDALAMAELLVSDDPDLDVLGRMSEAAFRGAAPAGSGLSAVEQAAIDRLLRAGPAREEGEGEGR